MLQFILLGVIAGLFALFFPYFQMDFIMLVFIGLFYLMLFQRANEKYFWLAFFVYTLLFIPFWFKLLSVNPLLLFAVIFILPAFVYPKVKNSFFLEIAVIIFLAVLAFYPDMFLTASQGDWSGFFRPILAPLGFNG